MIAVPAEDFYRVGLQSAQHAVLNAASVDSAPSVAPQARLPRSTLVVVQNGASSLPQTSAAVQSNESDPFARLALERSPSEGLLQLSSGQMHLHLHADCREGSSYSHTLLRSPAGESSLLVSTAGTSGAGLASDVLDIEVPAGASLSLFLYSEPFAGPRFLKLRLRQQQGSHVSLLHADPGSSLFRLALDADMAGEDCSLAVRAASACHGEQQSHRHFLIRHSHPRCTSVQFCRHVLSDTASASLDGMVEVAHGAVGTDSSQLVNSLLLSPGARASAKPMLRISADDVQCSHGATCGAPEPEQMFYLESRGLPRNAALSLLQKAFLSEVFDTHPESEERELLRNAILAAMESA